MLLAMHIPDGFLDPMVLAATAALALIGIALALGRLKRQVEDRLVPLLGVTAAGIFAGQMVNFPLFGLPVSGHLLGGVLAAVVLGPWGGALSLTAVLIIQCLLFGDGGVTALGANVVNMALIGSLGGYGVYAVLRRALAGPQGTVMAAVVASWLIVPWAGLAFAVEMSAGGELKFAPLATLMLSYHVLIAFGEALLTGSAVAWLLRVRPELIYEGAAHDHPTRRWGGVAAAGLSMALAIAAFGSPFASHFSDGLEAVAEQLGFLDKQVAVAFAPFPDYALASDLAGGPAAGFFGKAAIVTAALGILGTLATWIFALSMARTLRLGIRPQTLEPETASRDSA